MGNLADRMAMVVNALLDRDALAYRDDVFAAGGAMSNAQFVLINALIKALKAAGVWSILDRLWLFAAENATQGLIDLKVRAVATAVNSPTFTANRGYAGNAGRTAYIDSGFNPSTAGGNYTQNLASFGVYAETADGDLSTLREWMGDDETNYGRLGPDATNVGAGVNASGAFGAAHGGVQVAFWHAQRTASNAQAIFKNGVSFAVGANASVALVNRNFNILAGNNAGTPYQPTTARLSVAFIGGSLSGKEAAFYAAIRTYLTAVGVS